MATGKQSTTGAVSTGSPAAETADITRLERGVNRQILNYMRGGDRQQLECALNWMSTWAQANALMLEDELPAPQQRLAITAASY